MSSKTGNCDGVDGLTLVQHGLASARHCPRIGSRKDDPEGVAPERLEVVLGGSGLDCDLVLAGRDLELDLSNSRLGGNTIVLDPGVGIVARASRVSRRGVDLDTSPIVVANHAAFLLGEDLGTTASDGGETFRLREGGLGQTDRDDGTFASKDGKVRQWRRHVLDPLTGLVHLERCVGVVVDLLVFFAGRGQVDPSRKFTLVVRTSDKQLTVSDPIVEALEDLLLVDLGIGSELVPSKPCVHRLSGNVGAPVEIVDEWQQLIPALDGSADDVDDLGVHPRKVVELDTERVLLARLE